MLTKNPRQVNQIDVTVDGKVIGSVWNWGTSAGYKVNGIDGTTHNVTSAVAQVKKIYKESVKL